ncbi:MAG: glycoside hydrolase family 3 N-terminal domain-containing protein [Eubacteriales bacterium]|nr:glycoside hydrolase family 3 N-terminal domain-containing protein [Eubacteriales bacterium]
MKKNPVNFDPSMKNGYIPAPYVLEEGENINDFYLEPVLFHNENGPTIGVTTCGVIVQDGLFFKDMDNSGKLDPYKDWRLDHETRAKDIVAHLPLKQQAGLVLNTLWNTPLSFTREGAKDENGNIVPGKIFKRYDPNEPIPKGILPGLDNRVDDGQVLEQKLAAGVYRGEMRAEAGVAALYHNLGTQYVEYEACQGGVAIPYSLHTNPINIGYPDFLGMGAACLGDGNFDIVYNMAETDRKMMSACGLHIMYGPQVDVSTDPRWPRNSGTYGERPDITAGITRELVRGYQNGEDGLKKGSIVLTVKHFPGDGPAENGFEPHLPIGQWRLYPTEGSMEKYHLPPFQAAFDMKASAIMPDYSRVGTDGRSKPQYYRGKLTSTEQVGSTYSKELITDLARDTMGFTGYVNSDSGITTTQIYGVEHLSVPERYAKAISAGTDVIGGNYDAENIVKAVEEGYLPKADLDRANYRRLLAMFDQGRVDNPYLDPDEADRVRAENFEGAKKAAYRACQKEVVLAKNHGGVLPMAKGKKVYIAVFSGEDAGAALAQMMGAGVAGEDDNEALRAQLASLLKAKGYEVVDTPEECDYAYLHVWPKQNNIVFVQRSMPVLELVDGLMHEEREVNKSQKKTGNRIPISTLRGVDQIPVIAETVHRNGGKVIATCVVCNPWILDKLEPYVDGLTFQYTVSPVAMGNALGAQMDVLSGDYNPTGKMSLTMVSCPEVIQITEKEIDGVMREVCASPNDVPGYDKDQYIDPAILAKVKGGSYAYFDEDGNYYRSGFGLHY